MSFFFSSRRRHTRLQGDWSSDVCSSDLSTTWASSTISAVGSSAPPTPSLLKCYPCLRNNPLPMCPEWTDSDGGQGRNRTTDTRIFRPLSAVLGASRSITCDACQPRPQPQPGTIPRSERLVLTQP